MRARKKFTSTENMGRPKTVDGGRHIGLLIDDATFAELEVARGKIARSTFIRDVLVARLHVLNSENPCEVASHGVFTPQEVYGHDF